MKKMGIVLSCILLVGVAACGKSPNSAASLDSTQIASVKQDEVKATPSPVPTIIPSPTPAPVLAPIGSFSVVSNLELPTRYAHTSVVVGKNVYLFGGCDDNNSFSSVKRASVGADGSLGNFSTAPALASARAYATSAVVGNTVYVIGGGDNGNYFSSIERANVDADGNLGNFSPSAPLTVARSGASAAVVGNYLYVIGGHNQRYLFSVERAPIKADGTLGSFSTVANVALNSARCGATCAVIGNHLYVIGGANFSSVERALINADGTLGNFSVVANVGLTVARSGATGAVVGNHLFVIGGAGLSSVEKASINADGTLGNFSAAPALTAARGYASSAVVGNKLFVIGGTVNGVEVATIR